MKYVLYDKDPFMEKNTYKPGYVNEFQYFVPNKP